MKIIQAKFPYVLALEPKVFEDNRGCFMELYNEARYKAAGVPESFVQDNLSVSKKNVLRGLHYQLKHPQGKLVSVVYGKVFDVVVDIRKGSPYFGQWLGFELSDENYRQVFVPPGYAHGYVSLSDKVVFHYQCTDYYHPEDEHAVLWSDSDLAIVWSHEGSPLISPKDRAALPLKDIPSLMLPEYQP